MMKKNEERTLHFKPAKKQRLSSMQEVTINIGQMEFNEEGLASPLRGKSMPLKICKDADYKTLLEAALKNRDYVISKRLTLNANTNSSIVMGNRLKQSLVVCRLLLLEGTRKVLVKAMVDSPYIYARFGPCRAKMRTLWKIQSLPQVRVNLMR